MVCVLTVAAGQQRCYRGSGGAPWTPCRERLGPGWRLWSRFQMFPLMGKKHVGRRSQKRILPNAAGAKTQSGSDSRRAVRALLAGERLVLWKRFGRDSMSMNYWRICNDRDGQAFVFAPSPPHSRCSRPARRIFLKMTDDTKVVTSSLQLDRRVLIPFTQRLQTEAHLQVSYELSLPFSSSLFTVLAWMRWWFQLLCHVIPQWVDRMMDCHTRFILAPDAFIIVLSSNQSVPNSVCLNANSHYLSSSLTWRYCCNLLF